MQANTSSYTTQAIPMVFSTPHKNVRHRGSSLKAENKQMKPPSSLHIDGIQNWCPIFSQHGHVKRKTSPSKSPSCCGNKYIDFKDYWLVTHFKKNSESPLLLKSNHQQWSYSSGMFWVKFRHRLKHVNLHYEYKPGHTFLHRMLLVLNYLVISQNKGTLISSKS